MSITCISRYIASDGKSLELFNFLNSSVSLTIGAKGCISCELLKSEEMYEFVIIEKWESLQSHIDFMKNFPKDDRYIIHLLGALPESKYFY